MNRYIYILLPRRLLVARSVSNQILINQDRTIRRRQVYETIDRQGFQWVVVFVAGVGFFLDGYTVSIFRCFWKSTFELSVETKQQPAVRE